MKTTVVEKPDADVSVFVITKRLSDGSVVYDVVVANDLAFRGPKLHATSYNDAKELCAKIAEAIEAHTTMTVASDH